jgi:hypothetical protein
MTEFTFTQLYNGLAWHLEIEVGIKSPEGYRHYFSKAIWDTGATNTMISDTVVRELELAQIGVRQISGFHGTERLKTYEVEITLDKRYSMGRLTVASAKEFTEDHHVLLGMDIISQLDFAITNVDGETIHSIRFPSSAKIDFEVSGPV